MTRIVTRVFADRAEAQTALRRLDLRGLPKRYGHIITTGAALQKSRIHETAMGPYLAHLEQGHVILVVRATYKPLGAARMVRDVLAKLETVDTGAVIDDFAVAWEPENTLSTLKDNPLFLSVPGLDPPDRVSESFGMPLLKRTSRANNLLGHDNRISGKFWPRPLIQRKDRMPSVIRGGRHMSRMFWPMALTSTGARRTSVLPGGGFPFSRRFGMRLIN